MVIHSAAQKKGIATLHSSNPSLAKSSNPSYSLLPPSVVSEKGKEEESLRLSCCYANELRRADNEEDERRFQFVGRPSFFNYLCSRRKTKIK